MAKVMLRKGRVRAWIKRIAPPGTRQVYNAWKLSGQRRREMRRIVGNARAGAPRAVTYLTHGGLANRLRAHMLAWDFARRTSRRLAVNWARNSHCGALFDDLFERNDAPRFVDGDYYLAQYNSVTDQASHDLARDVPNAAFVLDLNWQHINRVAFEQRLGESHAQVRNAVQPRSIIVDQVEAVSRDWPRTVIGVHVRRGDFVTLAQQALPLDHYLNGIERAGQAVGEPEAMIFLASDGSDEELKLMLNRFGSRIMRRCPLPRNTTEGVQIALVDMLLLARTQHLVLTPCSCFGEMAAFIGNVPFTYA